MKASLGRRLAATARRIPFHASGLLRPDERLWLFHGAFEGNTRALYLWIALARPELRPVWLAGDAALLARLEREGLPAVPARSPRAFGLLARARFHFVNNYGKKIPFRSSRSFLVSLWHGVGIKNIGVNSEKNQGSLYINGISAPNFLVASSRRHAERFAASFHLPLRNCPILGTPRLDPALDEPLRALAERVDGTQALPPGPPGGNYVYAPTWRRDDRPFLAEALPDLPRLDALLHAKDARLYVKLHPRTIRQGRDLDHLRTAGAGCERILPWPEAADFVDAIGAIDVLVTDYSSIFADFLYLKPRGLVTYPFDLAAYEGADRSFHIPYDLIEGERAGDFEALCRIVATGAASTPANAAACARTRSAFWDDTSGLAAPKIVAFFEHLGPGQRPGLARHANRA